MISSAIALMLVAAPSPAAVSEARKDYQACLAAELDKSLKGDTTIDGLKTSLGPACAAKEQAFRSIIIAVDTAAGIKRADADENASFEIEYMVENTLETFRSYRPAATPPVKQAEAPATSETPAVQSASAEAPSPN